MNRIFVTTLALFSIIVYADNETNDFLENENIVKTLPKVEVFSTREEYEKYLRETNILEPNKSLENTISHKKVDYEGISKTISQSENGLVLILIFLKFDKKHTTVPKAQETIDRIKIYLENEAAKIRGKSNPNAQYDTVNSSHLEFLRSVRILTEINQEGLDILINEPSLSKIKY